VEEQKFVTPLSHLKALGLEISLLMGLGKKVSVEEMRQLIEAGRVLDYLRKEHDIDTFLWKKPEIDEIHREFQSMTANADDEKEKFGIDENDNGWPLLMACILEGMSQRRISPAPSQLIETK
jgi:hypothetical protein